MGRAALTPAGLFLARGPPGIFCLPRDGSVGAARGAGRLGGHGEAGPTIQPGSHPELLGAGDSPGGPFTLVPTIMLSGDSGRSWKHWRTKARGS